MRDIFGLLSNTADGVLAVDREQKIVLWNRAAEEMLGFRAEEVLGRSCSEVIGGRDESGRLVCHRSCRTLMLALRQELVPTYNLLVRTKDGQEVWVSVSTILVPSRRKDLFVLAHIFRNVSRQKEIERFVQRNEAFLVRRNLPTDGPALVSPFDRPDRPRAGGAPPPGLGGLDSGHRQAALYQSLHHEEPHP